MLRAANSGSSGSLSRSWCLRSSSCCRITTARRIRAVGQVLYIGVAAMGLNLLTGYNGQVSIGHGAFFGIGAYTSALLIHSHGWQFLPTLLVPRRCASSSACWSDSLHCG